MALRVRFQYSAGAALGYSIERLSDGLCYDFADGTFKAAPTTQVGPLTTGTGNFTGRYSATLTSTPVAQFSDGDYAIGIHNTAASNQLVGLLAATMHAGDDAPVFPAASSADPWAVTLPGSYGPATAGYLLGTNLDARVSSRSTYSGGPVASVTAPVTVGTNNDKTGYSLSQGFPANFAALTISATGDVSVGTNKDKTGYSLTQSFPANFASLVISSTGYVTVGTNKDKTAYSLSQGFPANFAALAISSTGAVTVGTNNDKTGYALSQGFPANFAALAISPTGEVTAGTVRDKSGYLLAASGLDSVPVEPGINARQALSPILAAAAGVLSGAGTGTVVVRGGNVSSTRITATTDGAGNRTSVVLSLPA